MEREKQIKVNATINAPVEKVWKAWNRLIFIKYGIK